MRDSPAVAELLTGLNPEQLEVVQHDKGPIVVGAVAGSGKTTALVRRIAYLVLERGVAPERILAVTFSSKAAKEMNDRLWKLLPRSGARVGTFHSVALQLVRQENPDFARWKVDERDDFRRCIKDAVGHEAMRWDGFDLTLIERFIGLAKSRAVVSGAQEFLMELARWRSLPPEVRGSTPPPEPKAPQLVMNLAEDFYEQAPSPQRDALKMAKAYILADINRLERQILTFDDMLLEAWRVLGDENVRRSWGARWDYILQDEAQDENLVQRQIAERLARDHRNYMVVGDPAQSIYGFRGSDPSGILAFEREWGARHVQMDRNYRSGGHIVATANGILGAMPEATRLGASMQACRDGDGDVRCYSHHDQDDEAAAVARRILESRADDVPWSSHVVLYRTNAQSRAMEEAMLSERIPYVVVGGTNFYERREVRLLLCYLRVIAGRAKLDDVRACINAPFRYLGKAWLEGLHSYVSSAHGRKSPVSDRSGGVERTASEWVGLVRSYGASSRQHRQQASSEQWCSVVARLAKLTTDEETKNLPQALPARVLEAVVKDTRYTEWLISSEGSESTENNRVSNVREMIRASERFRSLDDMLDYVEAQIKAARRAKHEESPNRVTMMSIHKSKGLEWPVVHVIGCNEMVLPHGRAEDPNEERRLAYVAFTRARDELHVSFTRQATVGSRVVELTASRFVAEAKLQPTDMTSHDEVSFRGSRTAHEAFGDAAQLARDRGEREDDDDDGGPSWLRGPGVAS